MKKITIRLTSLILSSAMGFSLFQNVAVAYAQSDGTVSEYTAPVGYTLENEGISQHVSVEDESKDTLQDYLIVGASESYSMTGTGYIYNMLGSDEEREFYDRLLSVCTFVQKTDDYCVYTPYAKYSDLDLTSSEAQEIAWIFHYDNPQFFWMKPSYWYGSSGLRFEIYDYYWDGADRTYAQEQFDASAQEYIDGAMQYDTERERSYYLFEALNNNITYGSSDLDQSAASALIDGVSVCAGFSKAYQMLCEAVGVEALSMVSENHAWNAIKLSGEWYLTDITYGIYGYTTEEMHNLDVKRNNYHTTTITYSDGTEETISFYVHDISNRTYPTYYDSFPICDTLLTDASGNSAATTTTDYTYDAYIIAYGDTFYSNEDNFSSAHAYLVDELGYETYLGDMVEFIINGDIYSSPAEIFYELGSGYFYGYWYYNKSYSNEEYRIYISSPSSVTETTTTTTTTTSSSTTSTTTTTTTSSSTTITTTTTTTTTSQQPTAVIIAEPDESLLYIGNVFRLEYLGPSGLTWYTDNSDVVKVSSNGVVTVVGAGTATIIAMAPSGNFDEISITIPNASIVIYMPDEADLFIGNTFPLSYTAESALRWFSSDSDVAKIDSAGNVTVTGYGTVTILAIDKNGKSAELLLTIQPKSELVTGDVDMDGMVGLSDASIALTIYANISAGLSVDNFTQEQFTAADVNGDGTITIADVAAILTYYAHTSSGLFADWNEILG